MVTAYIALGSNLGDRLRRIREAINAIDALEGVAVSARSRIYETPPAGPSDQPAYLNAVVEVETTLEAMKLLERLRMIERAAGRGTKDRVKWGPRELDLDIVLYGDAVIDEPGLVVPHPRLAERWFVLRPLCDVSPDVTHPMTGRTARQMLEALPCDDATGQATPGREYESGADDDAGN